MPNKTTTGPIFKIDYDHTLQSEHPQQRMIVYDRIGYIKPICVWNSVNLLRKWLSHTPAFRQLKKREKRWLSGHQLFGWCYSGYLVSVCNRTLSKLQPMEQCFILWEWTAACMYGIYPTLPTYMHSCGCYYMNNGFERDNPHNNCSMYHLTMIPSLYRTVHESFTSYNHFHSFRCHWILFFVQESLLFFRSPPKSKKDQFSHVFHVPMEHFPLFSILKEDYYFHQRYEDPANILW